MFHLSGKLGSRKRWCESLWVGTASSLRGELCLLPSRLGSWGLSVDCVPACFFDSFARDTSLFSLWRVLVSCFFLEWGWVCTSFSILCWHLLCALQTSFALSGIGDRVPCRADCDREDSCPGHAGCHQPFDSHSQEMGRAIVMGSFCRQRPPKTSRNIVLPESKEHTTEGGYGKSYCIMVLKIFMKGKFSGIILLPSS